MQEVFTRYPALIKCQDEINAVLELMQQTYESGGKILLCGNGGSCADGEHIVGELMKGFLNKRAMNRHDQQQFKDLLGDASDCFVSGLQYGIPALSLNAHGALLSAFSNDVDASLVFAQQVWGLGNENDLLIGISTSGNSANVINAMITANVKHIKCVGLTGKNPCKMDQYCSAVIHVPEVETYKVQELHLPVYHYLCAQLEENLFGGVK